MKPNIVLQKRDLTVLERLCDFGYLTVPQIARFVFKTSQSNTYRRMQMLREAGFVIAFPRRSIKFSLAYAPNMKRLQSKVDGYTFSRGVKSCFAKPWNRGRLWHEDTARVVALSLLDIFPRCEIDLDHMQFQEALESKLTSKEVFKLPDLVVKPFDKRPFLVEVELSEKHSARYFRRFKELLLEQESPILYLVGNQKIALSVLTQAKHVNEWAKMNGQQVSAKLAAINITSVYQAGTFSTALQQVFNEWGVNYPMNSMKGDSQVAFGGPSEFKELNIL